jgi:hypothetical protein
MQLWPHQRSFRGWRRAMPGTTATHVPYSYPLLLYFHVFDRVPHHLPSCHHSFHVSVGADAGRGRTSSWPGRWCQAAGRAAGRAGRQAGRSTKEAWRRQRATTITTETSGEDLLSRSGTSVFPFHPGSSFSFSYFLPRVPCPGLFFLLCQASVFTFCAHATCPAAPGRVVPAIALHSNDLPSRGVCRQPSRQVQWNCHRATKSETGPNFEARAIIAVTSVCLKER